MISAWIGLAGVVVGAVLAAALNWWQNQRGEKERHRRELLVAGYRLEGYSRELAEARELLRSVGSMEPADAQLALARAAYMTDRRYALDKAMEVLLPLAPRELLDSAYRVTMLAYQAGSGDSTADEKQTVTMATAISDFLTELSKVTES